MATTQNHFWRNLFLFAIAILVLALLPLLGSEIGSSLGSMQISTGPLSVLDSIEDLREASYASSEAFNRIKDELTRGNTEEALREGKDVIDLVFNHDDDLVFAATNGIDSHVQTATELGVELGNVLTDIHEAIRNVDQAAGQEFLDYWTEKAADQKNPEIDPPADP